MQNLAFEALSFRNEAVYRMSKTNLQSDYDVPKFGLIRCTPLNPASPLFCLCNALIQWSIDMIYLSCRRNFVKLAKTQHFIAKNPENVDNTPIYYGVFITGTPMWPQISKLSGPNTSNLSGTQAKPILALLESNYSLDMSFHFETRTTQMRLRSKIETKFQIFHSP